MFVQQPVRLTCQFPITRLGLSSTMRIGLNLAFRAVRLSAPTVPSCLHTFVVLTYPRSRELKLGSIEVWLEQYRMVGYDSTSTVFVIHEGEMPLCKFRG